MKKVMGLVIGLLPVSVSAQCITPPDCASIGYTETSCDGNSLKCPFDTSKLYCPPCDSSFKYSCSGENIKKPIGNACNNKYAACECIKGATYFNGECSCDIACETIGNIYYSDGSCSSCVYENKTPLGIIVHKENNKTILLSLDTIPSIWAKDQLDTNGDILISNSNIPDLLDYTSPDAALLDFNGMENTQHIINHFGGDASEVAGVYCYNYFSPNNETTKHQWYLPAIGEIYNYLYLNKDNINETLSNLNIPTIIGEQLWSSTESKYSNTVYYVSMYKGTVPGGFYKNISMSVRCLLSI